MAVGQASPAPPSECGRDARTIAGESAGALRSAFAGGGRRDRRIAPQSDATVNFESTSSACVPNTFAIDSRVDFAESHTFSKDAERRL